MNRETISAVATAPGRSGVAVVRISGEGALGVGAALTGRAVVPGRIMVRSVMGEECVVLAFKAPHSYTGEDVVEIQCHGGMVAPRRILDATLRCGARLAQRGEFTQRAFLNGRICYEQAQAVIDLIDARTDQAAETALSGLASDATRRLRTCYDAAIEISSKVEHSLDIDEGELPQDFNDEINTQTAALIAALDDAVRKLRTRSIMRHGALVVLAGEPNVGKSSLFNALVQENRAIVSPTAGTTRDAIEAWLDIEGWPVRLVDTAGLRESSDAIESEGVRRTEDYMSKADIVCRLRLDATATPQDGEARKTRPATLLIHPKCDLSRGQGINVSSKTGEGLDELRRNIAAILERIANDGGLQLDDEQSENAVAVILEAHARLRAALAAPDDLVLVGNALRSAAETLGRHIGAEYSSDMLDRLFSRFCVGK